MKAIIQAKPDYPDGKCYHSLDFELRKRFGEKIYRISLNGGMSCPNRDPSLGTGGCIFCSRGGSGDFAESKDCSITEQIETGKSRILKKAKNCSHFIAYFQAYTNTYAPVDYLRSIFMEAIQHPDVVALSIATRPDCLGEDVLNLLEELNQIKPVWIELGLQTIHEETTRLIRRGFDLSCFETAVYQLKKRHLEVIVHVILGLPYESEEMMKDTVKYLARQPINGIKLQLLHILKETDLADSYAKNPFPVFQLESYVNLLIDCVELLPQEITIHRLTGDGPKSLLIAPLWSGDKKRVLNTIQKTFKERDTWQGKFYSSN